MTERDTLKPERLSLFKNVESRIGIMKMMAAYQGYYTGRHSAMYCVRRLKDVAHEAATSRLRGAGE